MARSTTHVSKSSTLIHAAVAAAAAAAVPLAGAPRAWASDARGAQSVHAFDISSALRGLRIQPNGAHGLTALPLNSPPIGGFSPRVVFGLTDEQEPDDISFAAHMSSTPGGNILPMPPAPVSPLYFVATYDTGAQSHIVRYNDAQAFDLESADRLGNYVQDISGASGTESTDISDGLGIYMTGFANASSNGSNLSATPGTLRGQTNTAILTTLPDSALPNIIGTPMMAQYQTVIKNSQPRQLTVAGQTYRSPNVLFQAQNTPRPNGYTRLPLEILSGNGVSPDPVFFPSLDNFNNWADNPATPTFWASPFANVSGSDETSSGSASMGTQQFLFDTGAEVTVLSEDTAQLVGFDMSSENPSTPEFFVEVQGVGGTTVQVPGFYMSQFSVAGITWQNVPVLVLNLPDPRDFIGLVPGVIGMNLFTDRDLIINGGTGDPYVGISAQWQWASDSSGNWSDSAKWTLAIPNGVDAQANFYGRISQPQTVTVDGAGFTAGTINFDNANRYTIAGPGRITISAALNDAQVNVFKGSHTISAPVTLASDTTFNVRQATDTLTVSNDVIATGRTIAKIGAGALEMKNVRAAALDIDAGTLRIIPNGTNAAASNVASLSIETSAATTARFDLTNNALAVDYSGASPIAAIRQYLVKGYANGAWNGAGGITSSSATSRLGLGYADNNVLHLDFFAGQDVDDTSVLIRLTRYGDADLNGLVNLADFNALAGNFNGTNRGWWQGDFNYDGLINLADFNLLAGNFNLAALTIDPTPQNWANLAAAVPEPAGVMLFLGMLASATMIRRRRSAWLRRPR